MATGAGPKGKLMKKDIFDRFFSKVLISDNCHIWIGGHKDGYGRFYANGKTHQSHRWLYEQLRVQVSQDLVCDHICRNHSCVNLDHLEIVTNAVNILRGEGASAINARKELCINGHPLTGNNLYVRSDGQRACKACRKKHQFGVDGKRKRGPRFSAICERCGNSYFTSRQLYKRSKMHFCSRSCAAKYNLMKRNIATGLMIK